LRLQDITLIQKLVQEIREFFCFIAKIRLIFSYLKQFNCNAREDKPLENLLFGFKNMSAAIEASPIERTKSHLI
jgi:hypothetical protein